MQISNFLLMPIYFRFKKFFDFFCSAYLFIFFIYLFVSSAKALIENEEKKKKKHTHTQKKKVYSHALIILERQ